MNNEQQEISFLSFLVGIRGDADFQVQTNVNGTTIADYIDAVGQIEVNTLLLAFKTGGMECLTQFLQNKEIIILAYIKSLKENLEAYGITEEQYEQLEIFFGLKQLEETIEANKNKQREEILKGIEEINK